MTELRAGYWGEVGVGSYIQDPKGADWAIRDERDGWLRIESRDGQTLTFPRPDHAAEVKIYGQEIPEAIFIAADTLGAVEIADTTPPEYRCFAFPAPKSGKLAAARAHLWIMHFEYTKDVKTMLELIDCHDFNHSEPRYSERGTRRHVHSNTPEP